MRAPRCVSAFPITNLKRRRLRQSSYPLSPPPLVSTSPPVLSTRTAFPFSPLAPIPSPPFSLFSHPFLIAIASVVAWLRASCSSQLQLHISGEGKKKKRREEKRRNVEKRWESRCDRKNGRGWEEIGRRNEIRARHFRPVKPITTTFFARSITRNRVNCKLTRRVEETFENLKRQLDRLSRRSSRRPSEIR